MPPSGTNGTLKNLVNEETGQFISSTTCVIGKRAENDPREERKVLRDKVSTILTDDMQPKDDKIIQDNLKDDHPQN